MTTETIEVARLGRRGWRLSLIGTFIATVGNGMTFPFFVVYVHGVLGASLTLAGIIVAVTAVAGIAASLLSGMIGDRLGLGRLLVIALAVMMVGTGSLALSRSIPVAAIGDAFATMGYGLVLPALAGLTAVQLPPTRRQRGFAIRFGVVNAGVGVGSLIAGAIASVDQPDTFHLLYGLDAASTLVFVGIAIVGMRGTPGWVAAPTDPAATPETGGYRAALRDRPFVRYLVVAMALGVFGYGQINGPWAAFATTDAHSTARVVGWGFAANTLAIVVLQLGVTWIGRRWRHSTALAIAALTWAVAWGITGLAALPALRGLGGATLLIVSLAVFGLGETLFSPATSSLTNALAPDGLRARYNGLNGMATPVGFLIGSPISGLLLDTGPPALWTSFVVGGALATAALALLLRRGVPDSGNRPPAPPA